MQPPDLGQQQVDGHADQRVLRDPLSLSASLAVQRPAEPRQLVELVGPEPEFFALKSLPLRSL